MSKKYLVTGAAGFIASQVCNKLLDQGDQVIGVDNLNDYYDVRLKNWRLNQLNEHPNTHSFTFIEMDIDCLLYTSPSPRDAHESRMPSSA